jgi:hypothetical protein
MKAVVQSAEVWAGLVDNEPACLYGIIPPTLLSNRAYLWLLTTDLLDQHKFLLIRHSQIVIDRLLEQFDTLVGNTMMGDKRAVKWLKWLGAEFGYPERGIAPFHITRETHKARRWTQ